MMRTPYLDSDQSLAGGIQGVTSNLTSNGSGFWRQVPARLVYHIGGHNSSVEVIAAGQFRVERKGARNEMDLNHQGPNLRRQYRGQQVRMSSNSHWT